MSLFKKKEKKKEQLNVEEEKLQPSFEIVDELQNGFLVAKNDEGKVGLVDQNGKVVVPFKYENIRDHIACPGFVVVYNNGKMGYAYVDTGEEAIPCEYDNINVWEPQKFNGFFVCSTGKGEDKRYHLCTLKGSDGIFNCTSEQFLKIKQVEHVKYPCIYVDDLCGKSGFAFVTKGGMVTFTELCNVNAYAINNEGVSAVHLEGLTLAKAIQCGMLLGHTYSSAMTLLAESCIEQNNDVFNNEVE